VRPKGLQAVANGVSLLPWRKITGTCSTRPLSEPKPITGLPRKKFWITRKWSGNVVPISTPLPGDAPLANPVAPNCNRTATMAAMRRCLVDTIASPRYAFAECREREDFRVTNSGADFYRPIAE